MKTTLFIWLQYLLPQHALSRLVGAAARSRLLARPLIRAFMAGFRPDLGDAEAPDPRAYPTFNAFFTRALRAGARPLPADPQAIACPVDGTVSQAGNIGAAGLLQAKGQHYSLLALLAGNAALAERFRDGCFVTIYLAPYNYHRIHVPLAGRLQQAWFVPGALFSVNAATAARVPGLFARNERVLLGFEGDACPFAVVFVGALNVGSMDTIWHGTVAPGLPRGVRELPVPAGEPATRCARGAEIGRFNMGSTVILLFPRDAVELSTALQPGQVVRMGESIGRLRASAANG